MVRLPQIKLQAHIVTMREQALVSYYYNISLI